MSRRPRSQNATPVKDTQNVSNSALLAFAAVATPRKQNIPGLVPNSASQGSASKSSIISAASQSAYSAAKAKGSAPKPLDNTPAGAHANASQLEKNTNNQRPESADARRASGRSRALAKEEFQSWRNQWTEYMSRCHMYLDFFDAGSIDRVQPTLLKLGCTIDPFFDNAINILVTKRPITGDHPPTDVISKARSIDGIKIWTFEKLVRFLTNICGGLLPGNSATTATTGAITHGGSRVSNTGARSSYILQNMLKEEQIYGSVDIDVKRDDFYTFQGPYQIVWDPTHRYKPLHTIEFDTPPNMSAAEWPQLTPTGNGRSPFCAVEKSKVPAPVTKEVTPTTTTKKRKEQLATEDRDAKRGKIEIEQPDFKGTRTSTAQPNTARASYVKTGDDASKQSTFTDNPEKESIAGGNLVATPNANSYLSNVKNGRHGAIVTAEAAVPDSYESMHASGYREYGNNGSTLSGMTSMFSNLNSQPPGGSGYGSGSVGSSLLAPNVSNFSQMNMFSMKRKGHIGTPNSAKSTRPETSSATPSLGGVTTPAMQSSVMGKSLANFPSSAPIGSRSATAGALYGNSSASKLNSHIFSSRLNRNETASGSGVGGERDSKPEAGEEEEEQESEIDEEDAYGETPSRPKSKSQIGARTDVLKLMKLGKLGNTLNDANGHAIQVIKEDDDETANSTRRANNSGQLANRAIGSRNGISPETPVPQKHGGAFHPPNRQQFANTSARRRSITAALRIVDSTINTAVTASRPHTYNIPNTPETAAKVPLNKAQPRPYTTPSNTTTALEARPRDPYSKDPSLVPLHGVRRHQQGGHCENCHDYYQDFFEHIASEKHRKVASDSNHWMIVDDLLSDLGRPLKSLDEADAQRNNKIDEKIYFG